MKLRDGMGRTVFALIALAAIGGAGCGGGGPEPPKEVRLNLTLTGAGKLNTCGEEYSNALVVRVYQLASDARISIADMDQLTENEEKELGDDLLHREEVVLEPGGKLEVTVTARPGLAVLAVVGNFCQTRGDCWRWVRPVAELKERTVLRFNEFCVEQP